MGKRINKSGAEFQIIEVLRESLRISPYPEKAAWQNQHGFVENWVRAKARNLRTGRVSLEIFVLLVKKEEFC